MTFIAIYYTENDADEGTRSVVAATLEDAKAVLKAAILAEGTHGDYRLGALVETDASFAARRAA